MSWYLAFYWHFYDFAFSQIWGKKIQFTLQIVHITCLFYSWCETRFGIRPSFFLSTGSCLAFLVNRCFSYPVSPFCVSSDVNFIDMLTWSFYTQKYFGAQLLFHKQYTLCPTLLLHSTRSYAQFLCFMLYAECQKDQRKSTDVKHCLCFADLGKLHFLMVVVRF